MTAVEDITLEVRALERLDLEGLRDEWLRRYGPPPKLRSPELLGRHCQTKILYCSGGLWRRHAFVNFC